MIKEHFTEYFWNVIKNQYFDFTGQATRKQFWFFVFWNWALSTALSVATQLVSLTFDIFSETAAIIAAVIFAGISVLIALGLIIPSIAIQCRRFRDAGVSPWWLLAIPIIIIMSGILVFFVFGSLFTTGQLDSGITGLSAVLIFLGIGFLYFLCGLGILIVSILPTGYFNKRKENVNIVVKNV